LKNNKEELDTIPTLKNLTRSKVRHKRGQKIGDSDELLTGGVEKRVSEFHGREGYLGTRTFVADV